MTLAGAISSLEAIYCAWLIIAAGWDFARLRIPNLLTAGIAALAVAKLALDPENITWTSHLVAGGGLLLAGALLFARGLIGGGDAKLLAAVGLWVGLGRMPEMLGVMAMAGGLLAVVLIASRPFFWAFASSLPSSSVARFVPRGMEPGAGVPYGIAIALAGILVELI
jgi:prepilin peptidase CpaA